MVTIDFILLLVALLCFVAAALGVPSRRVQLVPAGLALWMLSLIV
jgi:hypothetical protein